MGGRPGRALGSERHVLPILGVLKADDVTVQHVRSLIDKLTAKGHSGSSVRGRLTALSAAFRHGERDLGALRRRALAVVVLALALVSAAGANPQRSLARFCGSTDGAQWVAKRQDPRAPFAGTLFGDSYRVWRRRADCDWAFHKVAFLTHGLGTKYMNLANLGDFKCGTRRPPAREHILSLKPRTARGECWNTRPKSVARFEWRPAFPPP
jgi:hypothetical protein